MLLPRWQLCLWVRLLLFYLQYMFCHAWLQSSTNLTAKVFRGSFTAEDVPSLSGIIKLSQSSAGLNGRSSRFSCCCQSRFACLWPRRFMHDTPARSRKTCQTHCMMPVCLTVHVRRSSSIYQHSSFVWQQRGRPGKSVTVRKVNKAENVSQSCWVQTRQAANQSSLKTAQQIVIFWDQSLGPRHLCKMQHQEHRQLLPKRHFVLLHQELQQK